MSTTMRFYLGFFVASVLALGLVAYFTYDSSPSVEQTSNTEKVKLAGPWQNAKAQWAVDGSVYDLVALPVNVAFTVINADGGSEFFMYSPEGKVVAHAGVPEKLKGTRYTTMLDTARVDGKMFLTVMQSDDFHLVATGFDEDGKQLFRKEADVDSSLSNLSLDPVTGAALPKVKEVDEGPRVSISAGAFDGVAVKRSFEKESAKSSLSAPGWEREVPAQASIEQAGAYIAVISGHDFRHSADAARLFQGGAPYCRLINPHSGEDVKDTSGKAVSSCALSGFTGSNSNADSAVVSRVSEYGDTPSIPAVLLPATGQYRDLSFEQHFVPLSVDTDGTIYGALETADGEKAASTSINSTDYPTFLKDTERVPVLITKSGIAAFPVDSIGDNSGGKRYIFAVK